MQNVTHKINVLQLICPSGFYGAERWIVALANNIDREHYRCDLALTVEPGDKPLELADRYREIGQEVFELPMSGRFDIGVINRLCALIKERQIQVLHTHGYKSDIIGVIAARKAGIRSVCTPHGFENADDLKLRAYIWLGCQSMRFFDSVAPLSRQLCDDSKQYGVKPSRIEYIQNGVDLSEVEAVRDNQDQTSARSVKRIGFVGQMISRKNIGDLLDIFDGLCTKYDNLELILLGDGEDRAKLEIYAAALAARDKIQFLGFRSDRLALLKSFDLFVMTSSLEGIPRCLMESMAMGIPVAAYDIPGIDQLVTHEQTGLLASFGDKTELSQHWESLLFDSQKAITLSHKAIEFVEQHFSAKRMAKEYQTLFSTLAKEAALE